MLIDIDVQHPQDENVTVNISTQIIEVSQSLNKSDWGPKRDPLYIVLPISIIYVAIFLTGVLGNVSTCFVIARNKSMHTATNYYLFSLAVSDLLLLTSGLPPEIYGIWSKYPYIFGEAFCVLQGFAAETSANATVLTITAFTVERYVAICHPFLSHTLSKLNRAVKYIIFIWIIAMCLAIPQAVAFGIVCEVSRGQTIDEHCMCTLKRSVIPHAFEISTCVFFVAPMSIITVLYILIGVQLRRSTVGPSRGSSVKMKHRVYKPVATYVNPSSQAVLVLNGNEEKVQTNREEEDGRKNFAKNSQATRHVVKMLIAVVVAFFICWAPFHTQRLLAIYGEQTSQHMIKAFQVMTYISGILYYLSTTINPLLYHIMSNKFREAFKATFKKCCRKGRHIPGGRCYSTLSARSQANSHSNTDSYSHQSSLRYLEAEMARLHDSARPLVVSFRRKRSLYKPPKNVIVFDEDLQEALGALEETRESAMRTRCERDTVRNIPIFSSFVGNKLGRECSFIEVHNLQPTHVCPLSRDCSFEINNLQPTHVCPMSTNI